MSRIVFPEIRFVIEPVHLDGTPRGEAPQMRHLEDCGHFKWPDGKALGTPVRASEPQLRTLPPCKSCISRRGDALRTTAPKRSDRYGEPCPKCFMAMPLAGGCETCG